MSPDLLYWAVERAGWDDETSTLLSFAVVDRAVFGNREDALRGLIDRIEDIGVLVMVSGIVGANTRRVLRPEEFRGFALADPLAPLIFVNGSDPKAAQLFTIIHELAHIWLGQSALSDAAMKTRQGQTAEVWCNRVAAEVLVPQAVLRRDYRGAPTEDELERLSRQFARAVISSTFEGATGYRDAYRLLGAKKHETLSNLAQELGVA